MFWPLFVKTNVRDWPDPGVTVVEAVCVVLPGVVIARLLTMATVVAAEAEAVPVLVVPEAGVTVAVLVIVVPAAATATVPEIV